MGARLNFGIEASIGVYDTGIADRFLSWYQRQIPVHHPYGESEIDAMKIPID